MRRAARTHSSNLALMRTPQLNRDAYAAVAIGECVLERRINVRGGSLQLFVLGRRRNIVPCALQLVSAQ